MEEKKTGKKLDMEGILARVDAFFEANQGEEAERLMQESAALAVQLKDDEGLLQLLNELIGYYRETGQKENVYRMAPRAIAQAEKMGLAGTIPYATTLLNAATAYRACGRLQEAEGYYFQVQEIYREQLEPNHMLTAGLKNNIALLYQEKGDFAGAKKSLEEALEIAEKNGAAYETAVTCANLAGTCMQLGEASGAYEYANRSAQIFRSLNVEDSHFAAALATMGAWHYSRGEYGKALEYYRQGMEIVEKNLGKNEYYRRLRENAESCEKALATEGNAESCERATSAGNIRSREEGGLSLARDYYEAFGRPMIEEKFPEYAGRIAVGLSGRGSDCFGYDDAASRDHDWGPEFCMWVTDETYGEIGKELEEAYARLPEEFRGYQRAPRVSGAKRRGVMRIAEFYQSLTGAPEYEKIDWRSVSDASLAAAVNGEIFRDDEGIFTAFREKLKAGYPEEIRYLKLAESAARYAQAAQYNAPRMKGRGDRLTSEMMVWDGIKEAMKLQHYIEGKYPPHDKWLHRSLRETKEGREVAAYAEAIARDVGGEGVSAGIEELGAYFAMEMYGRDLISDTDSYLDAHSEELVYKASLAAKSREELAAEIAGLEFEAFDKVQNEGGRASCQNDWSTFSIMRKSQYLTWDRAMLMQYLYDFHREYRRGHNLIEEKYGRMMESTAPEKYEEIKDRFPELSEEKKAIIEQIVKLQVGWMEEFAGRYPGLAGNARHIHTWEDESFDTSYETYLRGELGTYSDKMLELYGRYVVGYARRGGNIAWDIMEKNVKMYGYSGLDEAEEKTSRE